MLKNYLKIALRNVKRYKGYSFINIAGLALGMACFILIFLYIQFELSYDNFHQNREDIYLVAQKSLQQGQQYFSSSTPYPIGRALREDIPGIITAARIGRLWNVNMIVTYKDKTFTESRHRIVDPSFFQMLSFPILSGQSSSVFSNPDSVVLSEEAARKYFAHEDPIGKTITINQERFNQNKDFMVSGVIQIPANSDFQYDFLFPIQTFEKQISVGWTGQMYATLVQLKKGVSPKTVEQKIWALQKSNIPKDSELNGLHLQKLSRVHLYKSDESPRESLQYIKIFGLSGVFILLIACINFMNLSTARSAQRAKEIGLRKTIGAQRIQIAKQFYLESFFLTFIAFLIAVLFVRVFLPEYNNLTGKTLSINFSNISIVGGLVTAWLFTAFVSSSYPALFLSAFHPIQVWRGTTSSSGRGSFLRKSLVIFQFSISIFFIISTLLIFSQLNFIRSRYLQMDKEHLIYVRMNGGSEKRGPALKNELLKYPEIKKITISQQMPLSIGYNRSFWISRSQTPDTQRSMNYNIADFDYIKTLNIELIAGRDFSNENATDGMNCIVNEEAAERLGLDDPVGKEIVYWDKKVGNIIGIVKDFNYRHLQQRIDPLILCARPDWWDLKYMVMRLVPGDPAVPLRHFKDEWKKVNPGIPVEIRFFDEAYDRIYRNEQIMSRIFLYFTIMTVFISCLGLFGLASLIVERRTKEIGIRKILGASVPQIVSLLSGGFTKWIFFSNVIAWPIAYLAMNKWLQNFAYRINIGIWIFVVSAALAIVIALLTVSFQSIKAASANPADSLRYE